MLRQLPRWQLQELPLIVIPNLFRDPVLILSEDGGPLMDNVAFSSDQRVFLLKRIAVSKCVIPSRDAEQVFSGRLRGSLVRKKVRPKDPVFRYFAHSGQQKPNLLVYHCAQ